MLDLDLSSMGLTDNQVAIYRAILEFGKTTPARLSVQTGINRTTVYAVGKELLQKGFIQEDTLKGVTYYYPTSPKELAKITKRERQALVQKELAIAELAKAMQTLPQSKSYAVPRIKFIEHEDRVAEFLYSESHKWLGVLPPEKRVWYGFQDHTFVEHGPYRKWIEWYWKDFSEKDSLYLLSNDSSIEKQMRVVEYERRRIKFWKKDFDFTESQWIVGDYSIMIMTRQRPHYLVEMHDAVYADNMRKLFKNLWEEIK
jgi:predicted transcriptional regulator